MPLQAAVVYYYRCFQPKKLATGLDKLVTKGYTDFQHDTVLLVLYWLIPWVSYGYTFLEVGPMRLTRRDFLKLSGATVGGVAAGANPLAASAQTFPLHKKIGEKASICPYCAVGCGVIVAVQDGKIVNIEGDPDNPINRGRLCSKGAAILQVVQNDRRLRKVKYRAPGSDKWEEKTWDWALDQIADRIKKTRDSGFVERIDGVTVNRCENIAAIGGSTSSNEECYLYAKLQRAMGLVYTEHQARI